MLSIFRTNQIFANILLIFYSTILHLSLFIVPTTWNPKGGGIFSEWIYSILDVPSITASILSILLLSFQAAAINVICVQYRMASEINLFPGVFYILIASILPEFLHLSPIMLGNTFLILALFQLMETYKKHSSAGNIFNVGMWIGIASMFYFSFIAFLIMGWLGLNILRAFKLKERLILLVGLFTPYFLVFTYNFWNDSTSWFWKRQFADNIAFADFYPTNPLSVYVGVALISIFIIVALFSFRNYSLKKNIRVQKNINILFLTLFISLLTLSFQSNITIEHLLITAVPLGILISFNFTDLSPKFAESLHLVLLTSILAWHYFPLFQF